MSSCARPARSSGHAATRADDLERSRGAYLRISVPRREPRRSQRQLDVPVPLKAEIATISALRAAMVSSGSGSETASILFHTSIIGVCSSTPSSPGSCAHRPLAPRFQNAKYRAHTSQIHCQHLFQCGPECRDQLGRQIRDKAHRIDRMTRAPVSNSTPRMVGSNVAKSWSWANTPARSAG